MLRDKLGRPLEVLRISVIDKCNFRCIFCMPPDKEYNFLKSSELLTPEEIESIVKDFTKVGVKKIRITGGEPLLRRDLEEIIERISKIKEVKDIALTTNGNLIINRLESLKKAGLKRITFSIHSLDNEKNKKIINRSVNLEEILHAINYAKSLGVKVKVNTVLIKGFNDSEILNIAEYFKKKRITVRFIEFMDVGTLNGWALDKVITAEEILNEIKKKYEIVELGKDIKETALRYVYKDDGVEFGIIASVSKPFCRGCNRARLSADGKLYTCLFSDRGHDIRSVKNKKEYIEKIWKKRDDRYSELRFQERRKRKVEMFKVGG